MYLIGVMALGLLVVGGMCFIAGRPKAPDYINVEYILLPSVISLGVAFYVALMLEGRDPLFIVSYMSSSVSLIWIFIHSIFTDFMYHRVDRWLMRFAIIVSFLGSLPYLIVERMWVLPIFIAILLVFAATIFYKPLGMSDTRALVLTATAGFTNFDLTTFYYGVVGSFFSCLILGSILAIKEKSWKVKIPLVPPILFPYAILFPVFA